MKKLGSLALAALMVTALSISASAANSYKAATGTPTIDGKMDDAYKAAEAISISNNLKSAGDGKTSGTARVLWDDKNIYVFFDITDPILSDKAAATYWQADSVEFFLDLAAAPGDITTINAGQYTAQGPVPGAEFGWNGRGQHWDTGSKTATYKSVVTDKGYAVEMVIPWGSNYTPKADAVIGVAFHINSDEDGKSGTREGEYFAGDAAAQEKAWSSTEAYDKLTLTSERYVAPVEQEETKTPDTADMGLIAAIASLAASGAAVLNLKKRK
ncbi:MAG: hypothetical protein IJ493_10785 [Clostridia bacterium]|nr:hypothetical protein [Clostridia bacterium]